MGIHAKTLVLQVKPRGIHAKTHVKSYFPSGLFNLYSKQHPLSLALIQVRGNSPEKAVVAPV